MLTFNLLLRTGDLDPSSVRLVRHRDSKIQRLLYGAALTLDPRFAQYQERQSQSAVIAQFRAASFLASFVADPDTGQSVFAGIWELSGERSSHRGNPFAAGPLAKGRVEFDSRRLERFDPYIGRLVIDWGSGTRAWVQRAENQDKPITELRRSRQDPSFPGYLKLQIALDQVEGLYSSWVQVLRNARGVYLLVHRETGDQYVGSACGTDGFFGRWLQYRGGHGGNAAMKELAAEACDYDACILEVAGSSATNEEIYERESQWKTKLGTRATGLNRN